MDPIKIVEAAAILVLGGWAGWKELHERSQLKKFKLPPNPSRCALHAEAINGLREDMKQVKEHLGIV